MYFFLVTPTKIETINTISDAFNGMNSDYCLCFVDNFAAIRTFFKDHPIFILLMFAITGSFIFTALAIVKLKSYRN